MTEPTPTAPAKRRVLVIDDDTGITTLLRRVLEQTGEFSVQEENDPMKAIDAARSFRPHLIFLDRKMPNKDGTRIAAELGLDSELSVVPIVFLTGCADGSNSIAGHPVMLKPVRASDLIQATQERALPAK